MTSLCGSPHIKRQGVEFRARGLGLRGLSLWIRGCALQGIRAGV